MRVDQTVLNVAAGISAISSALLINLLVAPQLVSRLGPEAFGFVGLLNILFATAAIVSTSLNLMASRSVSLALHRGETDQARIFFSSALSLNAGLSMLYLALLVPVVVYADVLFNVPPDLLTDVRIALAAVVGSSVLTSFFGTLGIGCVASNRLDLASLRDVCGNVGRLTAIVVLFGLFPASVRFIGFGYLSAALIAAGMNFWLYRKFLRNLPLSFGWFRPTAAWNLFGAGSSFMLNAVGGFLLADATVLMANLLLGAREMGVLALARTIPSNLLLLSSAVAATFAPLLIADFGLKRLDSALRVTNRAYAMVGALIAVPIAGFVGFGRDFFSVWLPALSPQDVSLLYAIALVVCFGILGDAVTSPLFPVLMAAGRLRVPALWSIALGGANVASLLALSSLYDISVLGMAAVSAVITSVKVLLVLPALAARALGVGMLTVLMPVGRNVLLSVGLMGIFLAIARAFPSESWSELGLVCVVAGGVGYSIAFVVSGHLRIRERLNAGREA